MEVKLKAGRYLIKTVLTYIDGKIYVQFPFNRSLLKEIKAMQGSHWCGYDDPPRKIWSITDSPRNQFQLNYLQRKNPYERYDKELLPVTSMRDLYECQLTMKSHGLTRHYGIFAGEMGVGKTLAAIEIMEELNLKDYEVWYIGPRSGVKAVQLELRKWNCKIQPRMFTYTGLVSFMETFSGGAPRLVLFDESSKVKNPTAQRSQAAMHLANAVRKEHGENGYVILMSGTPSPKSPVDWWNQAEIACPGFLKEGQLNKFKRSLCIIEERQGITGVYPHIVTWLDDENKCATCGQIKEAERHQVYGDHAFIPSVNEVARLYKRLKGLVLVQFKKDCLDLPEKRYQIIDVKPTASMLRTAKLITNTSRRAIEALTLCRELSDGFQYIEEVVGAETCPLCKGKGEIEAPVPKEPIDDTQPPDVTAEGFEIQIVRCDSCGGVGTIKKYARATDVVTSPKDEVFIDLLDQHEECGRFIVWGGFTATVDRLVEMAHKEGWAVLRVDGRGYYGSTANGTVIDSDELLIAMDASHPRRNELLTKYPKLCFVGHPQAGGMALTLTASPTELFYSNCFDGEARMQAEDRFHRMGMDTNRGATIIDLILLPTDLLVLNNLKQKKNLQKMSLGELKQAFEEEGKLF